MAKDPKFLPNGEPDRRGHAEGSKPTRFTSGDKRKRPGRPQGSKSLKKIYEAAAAIPVRAEIRNKPRLISTKEAIVLKERQQAMDGDPRAREHFLKRLDDYSPAEVQPDLTAALLAEDEAILASAFERGLLGISPLTEAKEDDTASVEPSDAPEGEAS